MNTLKRIIAMVLVVLVVPPLFILVVTHTMRMVRAWYTFAFDLLGLL